MAEKQFAKIEAMKPALLRAHKAGDIEAANRIAGMIRTSQSQSTFEIQGPD
jgi:hypothetical protein